MLPGMAQFFSDRHAAKASPGAVTCDHASRPCAVPQPLPPCACPVPPGAAGAAGAGRLMQLGAGGEVSLPPLIELCVVPVVVVSTPTTRMSPAGMPFAFTVTEPEPEPPMPTVVWT